MIFIKHIQFILIEYSSKRKYKHIYILIYKIYFRGNNLYYILIRI